MVFASGPALGGRGQTILRPVHLERPEAERFRVLDGEHALAFCVERLALEAFADHRMRVPILPSCPFCGRVAAGEVTDSLGEAVAFPDSFPVARGHALVAPRRHVCDLLELTGAEWRDVWLLVEKVAARLRAEDGADGLNLGANIGVAAGQTVSHAHVHVIPRLHGDVPDPRGGVRCVIPARARYWEDRA